MGGSSSHAISPLPVGKTIIITGGNTGIGYETAKSIAMMGGNVILAVRTEERGKSAISKMEAEYEEKKSKGDVYGIVEKEKLDVQYHLCDMTSLKSVMQFIEWFKSTGLVCDVLICNACTYSLKEVFTDDKWEATYQVNYIAHFLLVSHLLPIICQAGNECRIVIITSEVHQNAVFDPEYAANSKMKNYSGYDAYANCKLFQIMLMYSLDKILEHHPKVDVLCVDRGKLDALVFPNDPHSSEGFNCHFCCMKCCGKLKHDADGAETTIYAALDPHLAGLSRGYFLRARDKPRWPSREARNKELQEYLWKHTIENLNEYLDGDSLKILGEH
ncbi:WW domain-containing oxidoreductase-like [Mercenaria mercenaria]|uniref:WW domain-containing oxidoreductase-like n=1 Tax=Mercenaria mercenaria TaxID=6596 RepID=UPI001E1DCCBF|nr:WW domain-containing oxidoreductase-like [Mercenaria mercenaria]XP_053396256.1 WW domain-containing oxidoreductase-like [Mercenaria mercenaria]